VAIGNDKNTFFNDLDNKADIGPHFHKRKIRQAAPPSQNNASKS
jgi:hypothetical protein